MSLIERQPFRGLYAAGAGLGILATVPWHLAKSALPAGRPVESWTFQQALVSPLIRSLLQTQANMLLRTPLDFNPGSLGDRLEIIEPASATNYSGVLASKDSIKPIAIPALWYPDISSRSPSADQPVILHIHGGCFVTLDCRPGNMGFLAKVLGTISPRVLITDYRLACNPGGVFPAALQDALTAYLFLVKHEGSAKNIILSGDSVGANLVLGLLRYINSPEGKALGIEQPKAALLWSPWVDIASVHDDPSVIDKNPNAKFDFQNSAMAGWGARVLGSAEDVRSPYVTSIDHPFETETRLWYQTGDAEIWYKEAVKSYEQMDSIKGNKAALHIEKGATHDIIVAGEVTGFAEAAMRSAVNAKEFLNGTTS